MDESSENFFRENLNERHEKLEGALATVPGNQQLQQLLQEVDAALERLDAGTFGLCKECNDPIEPERLKADSLLQFCLEHLPPSQQRALEEDLELANRIQGALLPPASATANDLEVYFHYQSSGPVSGDYCDHILSDNNEFFFMIGDVAGKGVAASMLMAHLHATFRTLIPLGLPLDQIVGRASRMFCENTLTTHYATLVCGRVDPEGTIEICNAGHLPPLLVQQGDIVGVKATGLPLGMFCETSYSVSRFPFSPGETLLLYTDGLSEAQDLTKIEYGSERLLGFVRENHALPPGELVSALANDLQAFRSGSPPHDDLTIMAIRRMPRSSN